MRAARRDKSVDDPEQYCPEYDCNEDSNYERNHDGLAILSRQSHKISARARSSTRSEYTYPSRWSASAMEQIGPRRPKLSGADIRQIAAG